MGAQIQELLQGLLTTVILAIGGSIIGLSGGITLTLLWLLKRKKWISLTSDIIRGTPMLLQAMLAKMLIGNHIPGLLLAIFVFGTNSMAYTSQILLSAVNGVAVEQKNAAMDLGATEHKAYTKIVLPQALKNAIPALLNEFNTLLKESAIVGVINIQDLLSVATSLGKRNGNVLSMLLIAGVVYFIISYTAKIATEKIMRKSR